MKRIVVAGLAGAVALFGVSAAFAQSAQRIGQVASLRNVAERSGNPLSLGAGVFQNEVVSTGADSSVRLTFLDQSNLSIGPTSRLTLDKFVYNPATQEMKVNLTRGAFRFVSGNLDKRAYRIETPTATMGVRGTIVHIAVGADGSSTFTSFEGNATVCSKVTGQCLDIGPGQSVQVGNSGQIARVNTQVTFDDYCARNPTLCGETTRRAALPQDTATASFWQGNGAVLLGATVIVGGAAAAIASSDSGSSAPRPLSP